MMAELFNDMFFQIHLIIVSIAIPSILAWVKHKTSCLDKIDKRSFRQSQAMIILAQEIDQQTNFAHPKDIRSELAKRVESLLKDEKGNL